MQTLAKLHSENTLLKGQLASQHQSHHAELDSKNSYIQQLEQYIKTLRQKQFGTSSEKSSIDQLGLFNEAELSDRTDDTDTEQPKSTPVAAHTRTKRPRISIPADLPREDIIHDLPDDQKVCPHDGTALKAIGEETHEQLDIIPAQVKVLRHIRKKYACPCCERYLITANKPKQPIEKSIASPGLLAYVAINKYVDALPLYRQSEIFKRLGIELDRTNLANWMIKSGELIQPLINLLQDRLLEQAALHMDETPVQVLNEPGKSAQRQSYMWVLASTQQHRSPAVLFHYADTRSGDIPKQQLAGYCGALMVDGYEGYQGACDQQQLTRLGCWAHARRKFVEAQRQQPKGKTGKADQAIAFIQKLYAIEKRSKELPPDERHPLRQRHAKPVIDKLHQWLQKSLPTTPPKSSLGKALTYLHNQWPRLIGYLDDGQYPIDNNRAENAIRPFVIGRKNWLFSASVKGAQASANLYSLIETAKANGLEPYQYLREVFTELPQAETVEQIEKLLPWNCKGEVR